jgi:RimJ/RimL family protein N-acetyltransferase
MRNLKVSLLKLEPLSASHINNLEKYFTCQLTQYFPRQFNSVKDYFSSVATDKCFGEAELFTVIHKKSSNPIGCTGFFSKDEANRKIQIGGTWIGQAFQGTAANVEAKYLLLKHAFDKLKYVRVEFTTDLRNLKSQAALEKLGAKREGTLRNHLILSTGKLRDTVYFSIVDSEWPEVSKNMQERIIK